MIIDAKQLERLELIILTELDEKLVDSIVGHREMDISILRSFIRNTICVRLTQEVLGRNMEQQEVRYPADWWQAVKARFAPHWFRRRFPVREKVVTLTARELYPRVVMPEKEPTIAIGKTTRVENQNDG